MNITAKLYAPFIKFLPSNTSRGRVTLNMQSGARVCDVLEKIGIPSNYPKHILVNDKFVEEDFILKEDDFLIIIPTIAGG